MPQPLFLKAVAAAIGTPPLRGELLPVPPRGVIIIEPMSERGPEEYSRECLPEMHRQTKKEK